MDISNRLNQPEFSSLAQVRNRHQILNGLSLGHA